MPKPKVKEHEQPTITIEEMTGSKHEEEKDPIMIDDTESVNDKVSLLAINELLNLDKIKTISRIKFEQVQTLTKLYLFADIFNVPFTKDIADNILQHQISINGLGRKELVSLVQQRDMSPELDKQQKLSSKNIFK